MPIDIRNSMDADTAKLILGNADNAREFLGSLGISAPASASSRDIFEAVADQWEYELCRPLLRDQFRQSPKYRLGATAGERLSRSLNEWVDLDLGPIKWPCSQGQFDALTQRINTSNELNSPHAKDDEVKLQAVRFRRMKEIKTAQNDMVETLVFDAHASVVPTFRHSRQCDFFINGIKYDQKTAKSPGRAFQDAAGPYWRATALSSPSTVARYLYEGQDEGRFDADPRLYVVNLDGEDLPPEAIAHSVYRASLDSPESVTFSYRHRDGIERQYTTQSIVILLADTD